MTSQICQGTRTLQGAGAMARGGLDQMPHFWTIEGGFHKWMEVAICGLFLKDGNSIFKWMRTGGTPISGNHQRWHINSYHLCPSRVNNCVLSSSQFPENRSHLSLFLTKLSALVGSVFPLTATKSTGLTRCGQVGWLGKGHSEGPQK